ncbi:DUF397 domain-containing protein [Streptomyces xiaopingdaonensis]|uniref:DUF397 domain-containing protein n=1 Tax=Streptomyces xiaopingdaonensis TaxID=1565415 RepID=UPI0002D3B729|nr:DUF397 domain-containing protein [Streptomyces xiaopingdaonensis]
MTIDKGTDVNLARATWRKSSYSQANGACVEVAGGLPSVVPVRDSKDTVRAALVFSSASWSAFVAATKSQDRVQS